MGLDQYLNGKKFYGRYQEKPRMEDGHVLEEVTIAIGYWRKHPNLHGYIVNTFADGEDKCQEIDLSAENISQIIDAIKNKQLPPTEGFFFGHSDGTEQDEDLAIFGKALGWLTFEHEKKGKNGMPWKSIIYRASW
jgi:hypothetical protein